MDQRRHIHVLNKEKMEKMKKVKSKSYGITYSRVVPDRSTDETVTGLSSQIGRDAELLSAYGRSCREHG